MNEYEPSIERNDVLRGILSDMESHSPGESGHANRVAVMSVAIGNELGLSLNELVTLRYAATLHDVGKVHLNPELLRKLGEMNEEEIAELRAHVSMAQQAVHEIVWLRPVLPMIEHHHERWDGKGYPAHLAGERIPLASRIIAVAETYDILSFGTGYKPAIAEQAAVEEIQNCAGSQFDPAVVAAFLKVQPLLQPVAV